MEPRIFFQHTTVDKSGWPSGPWMDEPDFFAFEYKNYTCNIVRVHHAGVLNGYVAIPMTHRLYKLEKYDDIDFLVNVHGGITYGTHLKNNETDQEVYLVGFDTAHSGDYCPAFATLHERIFDEVSSKYPELVELHENAKKLRDHTKKYPSFLCKDPQDYKDINYVINECKRLVDQLIVLEAHDLIDDHECVDDQKTLEASDDLSH